MPLRTSHGNLSRHEGCTLTGALSVTTSVRDSVSVVHGPAGCAHHNFSLLHTRALDQDRLAVPRIVSSGMLDAEIVFGGEDALRAAIRAAVSQGASSVFVLSTCIAETIGDDVAAVCTEDWGVPVLRVPTAGFLGGSFRAGVNNALAAIAATVPPCNSGERRCRANIVGEKNLEYEVEENYSEVVRLLSLLGIRVNVRFVRQIGTADLENLGCASLNVMREGGMEPVADVFSTRFGITATAAYPEGFLGTIAFLDRAGRACGIDPAEAVARERSLQQSVLSEFSDLSGSCISQGPANRPETGRRGIEEIARMLNVHIGPDGLRVPVPYAPPVGTNGVKRMLRRWRCALHA